MKLTTSCYVITGLADVPPWSANAGFIVGQEITLVVDTGATLLSAQTIYGYATSVRLENKLIVINTEQHLDHINGNSFFREKGIDVYGHYKIARNAQDLAEMVSDYNDCITNPARSNRREAITFFSGTRVVNPNQPIDSETHFDLGHLEVQVWLTPGHTPSNISVYVPMEGVLFCGDCIVNGYLPNLESGTRADWRAWLFSLDRIAASIQEIAFLVPGHGQVLQERTAITDEINRTRLVLEKAIKTGRAPTSVTKR